MCGLTGYVDFGGAPAENDILRRMSTALAHRGPDGFGLWSHGNVGLAHRRLAVIDLSSAASQPMVSRDGNFILVFNGMIYNFSELRGELEALGYRFSSKTDTEVLLYVLIHWGTAGISRLNGMFAFAFFDTKSRNLIIGRDRYGIKPLYYAVYDNKLYFGSEQKALFAVPGFPKKLDTAALLEYFTFQNFFTDRTLVSNVSIVPPGHFIEINTESDRPAPKIVRYWDFHFREPLYDYSDSEYEEELSALLSQAVHRQMISDVPVGVYLSGGIDSGALAALAVKHRPNIDSFTCGFDLSSASGIELGFDERERARTLSQSIGTNYHEFVLHAGDMEKAMSNLAFHLEEPRVGQSYPNYYAAQLARNNVTVVLSGAGGDELFGGYPWRYYRAVASKSFDQYIDLYYRFWNRLVPNTQMPKLFAPIWSDVKHVRTKDIFRDVFKNHDIPLNKPEDYINHSLYFEAKTFLHGLLVVEDKISMAYGLESRVPFLDNDLVDFAMRCPVRLKLRNVQDVLRINENDIVGDKGKFINKSSDGKQILRSVMRDVLPKDTREANKQGFSAPDASWFKGESIEFVRSKLLGSDAALHSFLDRGFIEERIAEHVSGRVNHRLFIWSLLSFEYFLSTFKVE